MAMITLWSWSMPRFKLGTGFMLALSTVLLDWPPTIAQLCSSKSLPSHPWLKHNHLQEARVQRGSTLLRSRVQHRSLMLWSPAPAQWKIFEDMAWLVFLLPKLWVSHSWCTEMDSGNNQVFISIEWSINFLWVITLWKLKHKINNLTS